MTPKSLEDLYVHELRDLFSAETQLVEALPKLVAKATHDELRHTLENHLEETRVHRGRIQQIFENRGMSPSGETCDGMKGLVKEANGFVKEAKSLLGHDAPESVLDAGLIAQAQRVEHYEISAYGTVCTYAEILGHGDEYRLLAATLSEEKTADGKLNDIAKRLVNPAAATVPQ